MSIFVITHRPGAFRVGLLLSRRENIAHGSMMALRTFLKRWTQVVRLFVFWCGEFPSVAGSRLVSRSTKIRRNAGDFMGDQPETIMRRFLSRPSACRNRAEVVGCPLFRDKRIADTPGIDRMASHGHQNNSCG